MQAETNSVKLPEQIDLRGVKCPLNWARAKVRLENMAQGTRLALLVDDPQAIHDIPRAAEAHGHAIIDIVRHQAAWQIEIER